MPAETHQLGREVSAQSVLDLFMALLGDLAGAGSTLASLGVDDEGLLALWDEACEEFAERVLGPELEPGVLEVSMTPETAAQVMARLLGEKSDGADRDNRASAPSGPPRPRRPLDHGLGLDLQDIVPLVRQLWQLHDIVPAVAGAQPQ